MTNLLLILIIGHIIGDYYLQSESLALKKKNSFKYLILHTVIIFLVNSLIYIIYSFQNDILVLLLMISSIHFVIDLLKMIFEKYILKEKALPKILFLLDQFLHIIVIIILASIFENKIDFSIFLGAEFINKKSLSIILSFLIIGKPTNIIFSIMFKDLKPLNEIQEENLENSPTTMNVGRIIGILERVIILVLFLINALSSVGLIIAAKTLTRYNRISKEEKFAEYYLLGTLFSLGISFITILIFLK